MASKSDKSKSDKTGGGEARFGSKILNSPSAPNNGGFENRASQGAREHTGMEGKNGGGFETRVVQEQGTH